MVIIEITPSMPFPPSLTIPVDAFIPTVCPHIHSYSLRRTCGGQRPNRWRITVKDVRNTVVVAAIFSVLALGPGDATKPTLFPQIRRGWTTLRLGFWKLMSSLPLIYLREITF